MEQKTIGAFIAVLRKANGMTQKDLAEKLNVSDKTISRWERDDGAPDLSAIPVLAEIFGVTCDELLRGERRAPAEGPETATVTEQTPKGEKQLRRLLAVGLTQYKNRTYIAMGLSVVGLIAALIGNLAFLRATLGALLGAIFFAASIVCQVIFLNNAFAGVADAGIAQGELHPFKHRVIKLAQRSIGLTVAFLGFFFPLIWIDAYMGLGPDSLLIFGGMGAIAFLVIYGVVCWFVNGSLVNKGVYTLAEKEEAVWRHNRKWLRRCALGLVIALAVTFMGYLVAQTVWSPVALSEKIEFYDVDSFVAYMEQDIPYQHHSDWGYQSAVPAPDMSVEESVGEPTWYDENGNVISEEEALRERLTDRDGNVLVEYIHRNRNVSAVLHGEGEDFLPIRVVALDAFYQGQARHKVVDASFAVAAVAECLIAIVIYLVKRKKNA